MISEEIQKITNLFLEYLPVASEEKNRLRKATQLKIYCDLLSKLEKFPITSHNRSQYLQKISTYSDDQINQLLNHDNKRTIEILSNSVKDTFNDILNEGNKYMTEQNKKELKVRLEEIIDKCRQKINIPQ